MGNKKLEVAKKVIKENYKEAEFGIFNSRNICGDTMCNIYNEDGLKIDICYSYQYFEVFGLTDKEFNKLENYYQNLVENEDETN